MSLSLRGYIEQLLEVEAELDGEDPLFSVIVQPNYPMIARPMSLSWLKNEEGVMTVYLQTSGNKDYAPREFDGEQELLRDRGGW